MNNEERFKDKILKIWRDYSDLNIFSDGYEYRKHPLLPKEVFKNRLLFVGINPSFSKGSIIPENEKGIHFYPNQFKDSCADIPYFEKMKDVANYCQCDWTHLDLLFIRETKQKIIEKLSHDKKGIDFINAQLEISFEIIEKSEPKLIIVSNAFASELFGKKKANKHGSIKGPIWRGFELQFESNSFNDEIGTYEIPLDDKEVPVIFSGMLSGQRALDIGSLERLKWQAKRILDYQTELN